MPETKVVLYARTRGSILVLDLTSLRKTVNESLEARTSWT